MGSWGLWGLRGLRGFGKTVEIVGNVSCACVRKRERELKQSKTWGMFGLDDLWMVCLDNLVRPKCNYS